MMAPNASSVLPANIAREAASIPFVGCSARRRHDRSQSTTAHATLATIHRRQTRRVSSVRLERSALAALAISRVRAIQAVPLAPLPLRTACACLVTGAGVL